MVCFGFFANILADNSLAHISPASVVYDWWHFVSVQLNWLRLCGVGPHLAGCVEVCSCDLQISNGIGAYHAEAPRILMVSSAAVERNAIIGDDGGQCLCLWTAFVTH